MSTATITLATGAKAVCHTGRNATEVLARNRLALADLIARQVAETYEPPPNRLAQPRAAVRRALEAGLAKVRLPRARKAFEALLLRLGPPNWFFAWSLPDELEWSRADTEALLAQDRLAAALVDDRITALAGYKLGGRLADGRDVFELTKFVTHPNFRGLGLYRALRPLVIAEIHTHHPGAPILSFTKNASVIRECTRMGWRPIALACYSTITRRIGRSGIPGELMGAFGHWRAFIFDPLSGG